MNSRNGTSPRADDRGRPAEQDQRAKGVITGVNARGEFRVKLVNGRLVHARMSDPPRRAPLVCATSARG